MNLHFLTKDIAADYPRVDWIPKLSDDQEQLWTQFGPYHVAEYPEIILKGDGANWELSLCAFDSGRRDKEGRTIRVMLHIAGKSGEDERIFALVCRYVHVMLLDGKDVRLTEVFAQSIHEGNPCEWREFSTEQQREKSNALLEELLKTAAELEPESAKTESIHFPCWSGGSKNRAAVSEFLQCAQAILSGKSSGFAFSLVYLNREEILRALENCGKPENAAILLNGDEEKELSIKEYCYPILLPESKTPLRKKNFLLVGAGVLILEIVVTIFLMIYVYHSKKNLEISPAKEKTTLKQEQKPLLLEQSVQSSVSLPPQEI